MEISAGSGAASFGMVVILTMMAAMSFDPRRSWDLESAPAPHVHDALHAHSSAHGAAASDQPST